MITYDYDLVLRAGCATIDAFKSNSYLYDVNKKKMNEKDFRLSLAITKYIKKNSGRERYSHLKDVDIRPQLNRICMLTPPSCGKGYLTYKDKIFWDFIVELRNALVEKCGELDRPSADGLLVNYARRLPKVVEICQSELFKVNIKWYDEDSMKAACEVFTLAWNLSFASATPDDIKLKNKKTTSMGFPYEDVQGRPVRRSEVLLGRKDDKDYTKTRFITDWSLPKSTWRNDLDNGCLGIFRKQMDFIQATGGEITEENVGVCTENNIISVHNNNLRENCPDSPLETDDVITKPIGLHSKDRRYTEFDMENGIQYDGMMSSKIVNKIYDECGIPALEYGLCNRERRIYPSNNMMHTMGTVLATATVHEVEHSRKGNPSTNAVVVQDWEDAFQYYNQRGYTAIVTSGDCVNAEVTIATNYDVLINLIPVDLRPYLRLTSHSVLPYKRGFRYVDESYCSAVWYTTWFHLHKGNFEKGKMDWWLMKNHGFNLDPLPICIKRYLLCLLLSDKHEDVVIQMLANSYDAASKCVSFGADVWVNPKLATDDMVGQLFYKGGVITEVDKETRKIADECQLSYDIGDVVAFGMRCTPNKLEENNSSRLTKLFTSERMGFSLRDGMSTYVRCTESGYSDIINEKLMKYFGFGIDDYSPYVRQFGEWLRGLGVDLNDVLNEHSPSERLLMGKYVEAFSGAAAKPLDFFTNDNGEMFSEFMTSESPLNKSARVPDEIVEAYLHELKEKFNLGIGGKYGKVD